MKNSFLHLFEGIGIELEYALVDKAQLNVNPVVDDLIYSLCGDYRSELDFDGVSISNELAKHILEFKVPSPIKLNDFVKFSDLFHQNIKHINEQLAAFNTALMPTACHTWMNPVNESAIWPHENQEIYNKYHQIFNCKTHGWMNLQSVHLNLPFYDDREFGKLHAAIRLVLPLIPAIAASSPIFDGKMTGLLDARLQHYMANQKKIPLITGSVIPEAVFNLQDYQRLILQKIYKAIAPYDEQGLLKHDWLNSRGAILRAERQTIEIRVIDIQECPQVDLAILFFIIAVIKGLVKEVWSDLEEQKLFSEKSLLSILLNTMRDGMSAYIEDEKYLSVFDYTEGPCTVKTLLRHILFSAIGEYDVDSIAHYDIIHSILNQGNLSERILGALNNDYSHDSLRKVYARLMDCLAKNEAFLL